MSEPTKTAEQYDQILRHIRAVVDRAIVPSEPVVDACISLTRHDASIINTLVHECVRLHLVVEGAACHGQPCMVHDEGRRIARLLGKALGVPLP